MSDYTLILVLVALLIGLALGKAWERYKLEGGRLIDRRRLRDTPHYMLGLNLLADNRIDLAIEELTHATGIDGHALDTQMILGNLYRQKGQVGRAIAIHQALLQRPTLSRIEHAYCLLCLGLDYRHGGFIDRALEAFHEVLRLDPNNRYALINLQRLHEHQRQWADAAAIRERIAAAEEGSDADRHNQIRAFLRSEMGSDASRTGDLAVAAEGFRGAMTIDVRTVPAYLGLGDIHERGGRTSEAIDVWQHLVRTVPERAYLVFERLERAYAAAGTPGRFVDLCERLIALAPQDWRARLALARHLSGAGRHREALERLLDALPHNPHALVIHQAVWQSLLALQLDPALVRRYVALASAAVFYLDPHVCVNCRYRSTELLWQCPQCHEWNTFVEERIAPKDEVG
jgi:lipopolysaccharide biosynthesis regulator YciM